MKFVLYAISIYALLTLLVFFFQRRLLYFPIGGRPTAGVVDRAGLAFWPEPDESYRGLVSTKPTGQPQGTVIVFHGNAGAAIDRSYYVNALTSLGYRVLLAEYPGYGERSGRPSARAFIADAIKTVELAHQQFGAPIYLWGESLGSGVATGVAAESPVPIAGVILVTSWDALPRLAQSIYWYFPTRWLVLDKYDNVQALQAYAGPVAVVLAERDEIIPTRHSMRLYDAITSRKEIWVLENAGHNSWQVHPDRSWWQEVMAFVAGDNN